MGRLVPKLPHGEGYGDRVMLSLLPGRDLPASTKARPPPDIGRPARLGLDHSDVLLPTPRLICQTPVEQQANRPSDSPETPPRQPPRLLPRHRRSPAQHHLGDLLHGQPTVHGRLLDPAEGLRLAH